MYKLTDVIINRFSKVLFYFSKKASDTLSSQAETAAATRSTLHLILSYIV